MVANIISIFYQISVKDVRGIRTCPPVRQFPCVDRIVGVLNHRRQQLESLNVENVFKTSQDRSRRDVASGRVVISL